MIGGAWSMLNVWLVTDALFPARSLALPETVWFAPSVETVWSGGQIAMPEPASEHVKCPNTEPLFQPAAFGGGLSATLIVGAPKSMLNELAFTDAVLPALSAAVPLTI